MESLPFPISFASLSLALGAIALPAAGPAAPDSLFVCLFLSGKATPA